MRKQKKNYRDYTDDDIIKITGEVTSMAQLLTKLSLKVAGGNYANMRRNLQRLKLVCDHWTGPAWNKDKQLKDWSSYTRNTHLKKHLIKLRGNKCENKRCNLTKWLGELIKLELHHIDGDRTHNKEKNFQLLCPNCHSFTKNFRNRKN